MNGVPENPVEGGRRLVDVGHAEYTVAHLRNLAIGEGLGNLASKVTVAHGVAEVLEDFTNRNDKMHQEGAEAARMVNVADWLNGDHGEIAKSALFQSLRDGRPLGAHTSFTRGQYLASVGLDVVPLNAGVTNEISTIEEALSRESLHSVVEALNADADFQPEKSVWLTEVPYNVIRIGQLASTVSLESSLIKSSQILDSLRDPDRLAEMSHTDQLRTIFAAESIYQPMAELTTFDALAATLLGQTYRLRFRNSGLTEITDATDKIMRRAGSPEEIEGQLPKLMRTIYGSLDGEALIDNGVHSHGVLWHEGEISLRGEQGPRYRVVTRLKHPGAVDRKLSLYKRDYGSYEGKVPPDILAATIIVPDEASIGGAVSYVLKNVIENSHTLKLQSAPGKTEPIHIKGSTRYHDAVIEAANGNLSATNVDYKPHDGDFQVAKITFIYTYRGFDGQEHELPVEVQFMTDKDRQAIRIGKDSHPHFKNQKYSLGIQPVLTDEEVQMSLDTQLSLYERRLDLDAGKFSIRKESKGRLDSEIREYNKKHPEFARLFSQMTYPWT